MKGKWLKFPGRMRTLLRKGATGLYLQGPGRWTANPAEALDFVMIDRALEFIRTWKLQDVEFAFAFDEFGAVTGVPLERTALPFSLP